MYQHLPTTSKPFSPLSGVCGFCSVDDMVVAAVISLQDPVGSGLDDICTWIEVGKMALFNRFLLVL